MTPEDITAILSESVSDISGQLADVADADLVALATAEEAAAKPRSTLLAAIEDEQERRAEARPDADTPPTPEGLAGAGEADSAAKTADDPDAAPAEAATDGGKEARGEATPAWQAPDYSGPLHIEQAEWRNQHLRRK